MPLQLTQGPFVADRIEDEVIIVNLHSGVYYSLRKLGADVWVALDEGVERETLVERVMAAHGLSAPNAAASVDRLLAELVAEGIVVDGDGEFSDEAIAGRSAGGEPAEDAQLVRFTDMQELIMLDPVHDVDEAGWPTKPQPSE